MNRDPVSDNWENDPRLQKLETDASDMVHQHFRLFDTWQYVSTLPGDSQKRSYVIRLENLHYLESDDIAFRFFRQFIIMSLDQKEKHQPWNSAIDKFGELLLTIWKVLTKEKSVEVHRMIFARIEYIMIHGEDNGGPRAFSRLFMTILQNLATLDRDKAYYDVLAQFSNCLHSLRPQRIPGMRYAWLEVISHTGFFDKLIGDNQGRNWGLYNMLLRDMLLFLHDNIDKSNLTPLGDLYDSVRQVLLKLRMHFPMFLSLYKVGLVAAIPLNCKELQNIVCGATQ